ncbi:MAG: hypothetical protein R2939_04685 [Kofleriaceae bacterium]
MKQLPPLPATGPRHPGWRLLESGLATVGALAVARPVMDVAVARLAAPAAAIVVGGAVASAGLLAGAIRGGERVRQLGIGAAVAMAAAWIANHFGAAAGIGAAIGAVLGLLLAGRAWSPPRLAAWLAPGFVALGGADLTSGILGGLALVVPDADGSGIATTFAAFVAGGALAFALGPPMRPLRVGVAAGVVTGGKVALMLLAAWNFGQPYAGVTFAAIAAALVFGAALALTMFATAIGAALVIATLPRPEPAGRVAAARVVVERRRGGPDDDRAS